MNKIKCSILYIFLLLVGCSSKSNILTDLTSSANSASKNSIASSDSTHNESDNTLDNRPNLALITSHEGLLSSAIGKGKNGFYEAVAKEDGTGNVFYYDYSTMQKVYLSSNISSAHNSLEDESFIEKTWGGVSMAADQNYIYLIKGGNAKKAAVVGEKGKPIMWRASLNGEDREYLNLPATLQWHYTSCLLSDNEYIYALMYKTEEQNTIMSLMEIDIGTNIISEIERLDDESTYFIVGAYGRNIILSSFTTPPSLQTSEGYKEQIHSLSLYNIDDKNLTDLKSWQQDEMNYAIDENDIYFYNTKANSLNQYNFTTSTWGEMQKLTLPKGGEKLVLNNQVLDGRLIFDVNNDSSYRLAFNTLDNTWSAIKLKANHRFLKMYAETENNFLVYYTNKELRYSDTAPDGTPFTSTRLASIYALISKTDFWSNTPSYRFFTDTTIP